MSVWVDIELPSTFRERLMLSDSGLPIEQSVFQQITNDIRRTDRSHPFYKGEGNVNIQRLE